MTLTFPRDLMLEAYLGRWVEVTALPENRALRQVEPVLLEWGVPNERGDALAPPSTAQGVLNNAGGHWTPGNAMGDYYAYLQGRNVPTRLSLRVSRDTFTRTVANGWGFSDTVDGWSPGGSGSVGSGQSVGSGVGTHSVNAANAYEYATMGGSYPDCRVAATCSVLPFVTPTGAPVEPCNLMLRYQPSGAFTGEHYLLRLEIRTDNTVWISIHHSAFGQLVTPVNLFALIGLAHAGNNQIRAAFQIEGQTLRGKAWDAATDEPLGWQVSAHHERLTGGFAGIRSGVAAGNTNAKPIAFDYDNWQLTLVRHSGEVQKLEPRWDTSHRVKTAAFTCADVTMRLGRSQRPALSSAPRRYLAKNNEFATTDYWPLDESATAPAKGLNTVPGGAPASFQREFDGVQNRGAVRWGDADQVLTSVPGFVSLNNGGQLTCATNTAPLGSVWSASWAMRLSSDSGAKVFFHTSTTSHFVFFFYTDGTWELFRNPGSASLATGRFPLPAGLDGQWVTVGLTVFNNGGGTNVGYRLNIDGADLGGGAWSGAAAYSALRSVVLYVPQATTGGQGDGAFSSLFVTSARFDTLISGSTITIGGRVSNVLKGWPGEDAGLRAFRLCAEEAVPFDYWGDLGQTRVMGPQRPIPLLDQLQECANVDGALLYAPRYTPGIAFRGRRSMGARSADATLDYSAGHLFPPFRPSADDRPTANLVRAERVNGGFAIVEQASGPMNTKDPGTDPDAVGVSPADVKVNVESETQLPDVAGWVRALGTVPDVRYPSVTVNLRAPEVSVTLQRAVLDLRPGDRLLTQNLQAADQYRDLDQLVRGGVETYHSVREHQVKLHTAPYEKYRTAVYGDTASRYDSGGVTTLDLSLTTSTTGARAVTVVSGSRWTVDAGAYPLDVDIEGERITLSGVTGTGPGQTFTISARSVNGVVKAHPAGAVVKLWQPVYYG